MLLGKTENVQRLYPVGSSGAPLGSMQKFERFEKLYSVMSSVVPSE